jgi:hypothetical protein
MKKALFTLLILTVGWHETQAQVNFFDSVLDRYQTFLLAADRVPSDSVKRWMNAYSQQPMGRH